MAVAWVDAVMDRGDLRSAWRLTDPPLCLVLVQHWIASHEGDPAVDAVANRDDLAAGLASSPPTHPLWGRFASDRLGRWREFWGDFNTREWKVEGPPERLRYDMAIVAFRRANDLGDPGEGGGPPLSRRLALAKTAGRWLVAGLDGTNLFRPGWPPTLVGPAGYPTS